MAKMKYTAVVLVRHTEYVSNETGYVVYPTSEEKLMDAIFGKEYTMVELYTKIGSIGANTLANLNEAAYHAAEINNVRDFEVYINGKS